MRRPSKILINVDSERFLFEHVFYVFNTCLYEKWTRLFCSFSCPNEHARCFLHMNIYFVLLALFLALPSLVCRLSSMVSMVLLCVYIVVSHAYKSGEHLFRKSGSSLIEMRNRVDSNMGP